MRITINLATRPYVELDRIFRQLRIAMGGLAILAMALGFWLHQRSSLAREQQRQIEIIQAKTAALQTERSHDEARLRQPQNAAVLQQIDFLNELFQRKSFSWTAVLMDLEEVLPTGVQVTSIDPQVSATGDVNIRMRVSGARERAVQLVRNLEGSKRFLAPRLVGESQQQQQERRSNINVDAAYYANGAGQRGAVRPQDTGVVSLNGQVVPAVDFDLVAGYNPLQLRIHEHASQKEHPAAKSAKVSAPPWKPAKGVGR